MYEKDADIWLQILKGMTLGMLVLWTIIANTLVFVVLYKNPRLQTVPNLLVANLAFSDLCLGLIVLPLSSVYVIAGEWLFTSTLCVVFVSADILCSTASIWNLSIVGLDRYWAITAPTKYMAKRTKKTAGLMILSVWISSTLISFAPLLGWKQIAEQGNMVQINGTWQCVFLDLPSYTVYSATGSFFIPLILMFFVYYKIYQAFAKHRTRQIYRQKVIRKHIKSSILYEISPVVANDGDYTKSRNDCEAARRQSIEGNKERRLNINKINCMEHRVPSRIEKKERAEVDENTKSELYNERDEQKFPTSLSNKEEKSKLSKRFSINSLRKFQKSLSKKYRRNLSRCPRVISATKERRGVKVLGIILGCFTVCWTPFFIMYVWVQFCSNCNLNQHIEMFITWLGYSNSAMNPIIYTVFNRDYQIALKNLFEKNKTKSYRSMTRFDEKR